MAEFDCYLHWSFPLALRISSILHDEKCHMKLDAIMKEFDPFLKELEAHLRRSKIRRVK